LKNNIDSVLKSSNPYKATGNKSLRFLANPGCPRALFLPLGIIGEEQQLSNAKKLRSKLKERACWTRKQFFRLRLFLKGG
jgi:hypothetical protein